MLALAASLGAQSTDVRLKNNREELDRIRQERLDLQKRMKTLQSSAHDISDEIQNLNKQQDVTQRAVHSLQQQLGYINDQVKQTTASLVRAQDEATVKRAVLGTGSSRSTSAAHCSTFRRCSRRDSFGELVARYKYLHEIALRDRALVTRVDDLQTTIRSRRTQLVSLQGDIKDNQTEKQQEEARLAALEHSAATESPASAGRHAEDAGASRADLREREPTQQHHRRHRIGASSRHYEVERRRARRELDQDVGLRQARLASRRQHPLQLRPRRQARQHDAALERRRHRSGAGYAGARRRVR